MAARAGRVFRPSALLPAMLGIQLWAASAAHPQVLDSGALLRQQQQAQPPAPQKPQPPPPIPSLEVPDALAANKALEPGGKLYVERFKLWDPSPLISDEQLAALLLDFTGRDDSFDEIDRAAARLADVLRKRGYAFVRVLVPQQEVVGGVVALQIVPGKISRTPGGKADVTVARHGKVRLRDKHAEGTVAAALVHPDGLTLPEVERGMLMLNSLPGVQGTGVLVPGLEPNTLGLALDLHEGPLFSGYADVDDFGSRSTGTNRVVADLRLNDPTGRGDAGELNLAKTTGTTSATGSIIEPLGDFGLRTRVAASFLQYHLLKEFSLLNAKGGSAWYSAGLSYPQFRTPLNNFTWIATLDVKQLHDQSAGVQTTSRRSVALSGGAQESYQFANNRRLLDYTLTLTVGSLDRAGNAADLAVDDLTRHSAGTYEILRANGNWLEQLTPRIALSALLQAQFSSRDLDSSEKLYLGGPRGVRAYPAEEGGSDSGQILETEARWIVLQSTKQDWTVFGLFDAGRVDLNQHTWANWNAGNPTLRNSYLLKGYGVGVRAHIGPRVQVEAVEARKLGGNPGASTTGQDADGRSAKNRVWFIATASF